MSQNSRRPTTVTSLVIGIGAPPSTGINSAFIAPLVASPSPAYSNHTVIDSIINEEIPRNKADECMQLDNSTAPKIGIGRAETSTHSGGYRWVSAGSWADDANHSKGLTLIDRDSIPVRCR